MYTMYTQSQTDISSVLWNVSPNRTEYPVKFRKVSRTLAAAGLNSEKGQLSRHFIAEISLSVKLNHNKPNQIDE